MKRLITLLLVLINNIAVCQQPALFGNVYDINKRTVPFATVKLLDKDGNLVIATSTNDKGHFSFLIDSLIQKRVQYLYASFLNRSSDTLKIKFNSPPLALEIKDSANSLSEVTIHEKKPTITRQADRYIFTPNNVLKKGASALDVLEITPLIQFDEKTDIFTIVNKENTLVYINNRKSNMPREMIISLLKSTPADDIVNIEIITNPGSEYSANTTGGIININLKRREDEGWAGNLSLGSQESSYNSSTFNGSISYRKKNLALRISPFLNDSYNYNTSNNYFEPVGGDFQHDRINMYRRYKVFGGGIGLDYDFSKKDLISFNGFISTVEGVKTQSSNTTYFQGEAIQPDSTLSSPLHGKDHFIYNFGNIYYQHKLGNSEKQKLVLNIDYNQYSQKNNDYGSFLNLIPSDVTDSYYHNVLPESFFNISTQIDYSLEINKQYYRGSNRKYTLHFAKRFSKSGCRFFISQSFPEFIT